MAMIGTPDLTIVRRIRAERHVAVTIAHRAVVFFIHLLVAWMDRQAFYTCISAIIFIALIAPRISVKNAGFFKSLKSP